MNNFKTTIFVISLLFCNILKAQQLKPIEKITIAVPSLNCEECEAIIENRLWKAIDGITAIDAMWKRKYIKISYATDRISKEEIRQIIAAIGFDADDEKADEIQMKKLPKCCQRVVTPKPAEIPKPITPVVPTQEKPKVDVKSGVGTKPVNNKLPNKPVSNPVKSKNPVTNSNTKVSNKQVSNNTNKTDTKKSN